VGQFGGNAVEVTTNARRDLRKLPELVRARVIAALERLAARGEGDVKALAGPDGELRLRVGEYRARFTLRDAVDGAPRVIVVLRVLHRREAYR